MAGRIEVLDAPENNPNVVEDATITDWEHSKPLDFHKWSDAPEVDTAVKELEDEIGPRLKHLMRKRRSRHSVRDHIKVFVLDLYIAWCHDPLLCLAYSRRPESYGTGTRHKEIHLRYEKVKGVADALEELGYVEQKQGFLNRETGISRRTRIHAKAKLIALIQRHQIKREMAYRARDEIVMRDREKNDVNPSHRATAKRLAARVKRINAMLESSDIALRISGEDYSNLLTRSIPMDVTRGSVSRIFNNGSFQQGGRFYGHWVQGLPREYRRFLLINGSPVVELDYASLHPNMLYAEVGVTPPQGDAYEVKGFLKADGFRPVVKTLTNCLINAESEEKAIAAVFDLKKVPEKTRDALIATGMIREDFWQSGPGCRKAHDQRHQGTPPGDSGPLWDWQGDTPSGRGFWSRGKHHASSVGSGYPLDPPSRFLHCPGAACLGPA